MKIIVQMGKVTQGEIGFLILQGGEETVCDPARTECVCGGAPEVKQGEGAVFLSEKLLQGGGVRVAVWGFRAVVVVDGAGSDRGLGSGIHGIPPEVLEDFPRLAVPNVGGANEALALPPEEDLVQIPEVPAVGDDAVDGGIDAREHGGLGGGGDGGEGRLEGSVEALIGES